MLSHTGKEKWFKKIIFLQKLNKKQNNNNNKNVHKSSTTLGKEILAVLLSMCMPVSFYDQYAGPTNSRVLWFLNANISSLSVIWFTDQSKHN